MFRMVNFDGGELPLSKGQTRIEQIPYLVMRIGEILVNIKPFLDSNYIHLIPTFCFTVNTQYKRALQELLLSIELEGLPRGAHFYEVDGMRIFENRGPSGGITTSVSFYLIAKD